MQQVNTDSYVAPQQQHGDGRHDSSQSQISNNFQFPVQLQLRGSEGGANSSSSNSSSGGQRKAVDVINNLQLINHSQSIKSVKTANCMLT